MTETFDFGGEIVWRPTPDTIEHANLTAFMRQHDIANFDELMRRSTTDVNWFTDAVLKFLDIQFYKPYTHAMQLTDGIAWPQWCIDGEMNIVHNCLDKWVIPRQPRQKQHADWEWEGGSPPAGQLENTPALIYEGEEGHTRSLTYGELFVEVNKTANALRSLGLGKGDAIGIYMPMTPEIVIALLAIAKIGGVILPLFSGYGVSAVVTRLADADAKALFTADGVIRRGKPVAMKPIADEAAEQVSSLQHLIVLNRAGLETQMRAGRDHWWHELITAQSDTAPTEITRAEDKLMIIYTSGTTGRPKGAVHTHCGFPVKAAQDMAFGTDVHPGDRIYWMTDMGWMMGPWLVFGALILGATFFIYDGAPDFPGVDRLWEMVARHKITTLGISPTLIRALSVHGEAPVRKHDLSSLHFFASTGEPWNPEPWRWYFEVVGGGRCPIINISGGTEVGACFLSPLPITELKPCTLRGPALGMAVEVWGPDGKPVGPGEVGELVCTKPWPAMTRGVWGDPERYLETYWSRWPDVWVHGDWASVDEDGFWFLHGRSDDTMNVAGKRLGPAEVESVLTLDARVAESAAVGIPDAVKGEAIWCFVVPRPDVDADEGFAEELRARVADHLGKAFRPSRVVFVPELPRTRSAKIVRRAIRATVAGEDPGDLSSLENPAALEAIRGALDPDRRG